MKKFKNLIIFVIVIIICGTGIYLYINNTNKDKDQVKKTYRTATVVKGDLDVIITATGVVKSNVQIDVKSEIGGKVIKLPHDEGDVISKGDLLAIIDDTQQKQKFLQTDSDYKNILSQVNQSQNNVKLQESVTGNLIATKTETLNKAQLAYEQAKESLDEQREISQAQIKDAQARCDTSQKQLDQALAGSRKQELETALERVNQSEITMKNAQKDYERQKELYSKDFVPLKAVDDTEKAFLIAQSQYYSEKANYEMILEGTRSEQIAIYKSQLEGTKKTLEYQKIQAEENIAAKRRTLELAQNDLIQAKIALQDAMGHSLDISIRKDQLSGSQASLNKAVASKDQALDDLSKTKIKSPMNAMIISRNVSIGDVVASQTMSSASGTTLMTIADLNDIYAEANVDESDIGKIRIGLPVTISSAAYPDLEILTTIFHIKPQAVQVERIPSFNVRMKILLDKIEEKYIPKGKKRYELFYPGMSVNADLHIDSRKDVLQLPIEAIFTKSGKKFVTIIKEHETFEDVEVTLGLKNSTMVEILSGVSVGDEVKIPTVGRSSTPGMAPGGIGPGGGGPGGHR